MNPKQLLAAVEREQQRRLRELSGAIVQAMTYAALAAGHTAQQALMEDVARHILALCSRRVGKTTGIAGRNAKRSMDQPNGNRIYIALTKDQARSIMWEPIWKPLCAKWQLPVDHNETRMVTSFNNGAHVRFTGTDDVRHIETELGAALDEATIDEAQSQGDNVLVPLVERILPPALADRRGTLLLAGTIPEVEAGLFWKLWQKSNYSKHNFNVFQNPHFRDAMVRLQEHLDANPGLTIDSPIIQREWFGRFVFDKSATAYTYDPNLNGYDPTLQACHVTPPAFRVKSAVPHPYVEMFSVGIDPGSDDRTAIEMWGWGRKSREVQHVFEAVTERGVRVTWGQIAEVLSMVAKRYNPIPWWYYDAGSSQNELDTFQKDYGVPVIKAAMKSDLIGQVRRNNDLLTQGRLKIMRGSALEEDYQKARWDQEARGRGQFKWASAWHPDPSEAARYALQGYFNGYVEPRPEETHQQADARKEEEAWKESLREPVVEPWEDPSLKQFGYG